MIIVLGKTDDDLAYCRFGLITPATDVEELVALVYATGKEIEESSRVSSGNLKKSTFSTPTSTSRNHSRLKTCSI
jgi:hypothetical protein